MHRLIRQSLSLAMKRQNQINSVIALDAGASYLSG